MTAALLLLLALQAAPAAPGASQVIIWGGGDTRAEAEASLRQFQTAAPALKWVGLPPGFPKVVESKDYPGLKPGFTIVILGICRELPERLLSTLKAVSPGVYTRSTTAAVAEACPAISDEVKVEELGTLKQKPWELSAVGDTSPNEDGPNEGPPLPDYKDPVYLVLRDLKTGAVAQVVVATGASRRHTGGGPGGQEYESCTAKVTTQKGSLTLERDCGSMAGVPVPGHPDQVEKGWLDSYRFTVRDGQISQTKTHAVTEWVPQTGDEEGGD